MLYVEYFLRTLFTTFFSSLFAWNNVNNCRNWFHFTILFYCVTYQIIVISIWQHPRKRWAAEDWYLCLSLSKMLHTLWMWFDRLLWNRLVWCRQCLCCAHQLEYYFHMEEILWTMSSSNRTTKWTMTVVDAERNCMELWLRWRWPLWWRQHRSTI